MTPVRTLVVDDEPLARERLRTLLAASPDVELVGECGDGEAAVEAIERLRPDLVFLDVQMPGLDGFGVVEAVGADRMPAVVFATAYDQHALRAFEVHALDYLLKPFDPDRFEAALARVVAMIRRDADRPERLEALLQTLRPASYLQRVLVRERGRIVFVALDEVDWIEAARNYVRLHTPEGSHLLRQTLTSLEERLDPERFLRIHRSTIVRIDRIVSFQPLFNGEYEVRLRDGTRLTLSRTYRERLEAFVQG